MRRRRRDDSVRTESAQVLLHLLGAPRVEAQRGPAKSSASSGYSFGEGSTGADGVGGGGSSANTTRARYSLPSAKRWTSHVSTNASTLRRPASRTSGT